MRSILLTLWFVLLGLVLITPSVPAADPIDVKPIDWRPIPIGGLNVSLATSGYRFQQPVAGDLISTGVVFPTEPGSKTFFVASVSLSNRSRSPIPFSFNDAGPRWTFRILDSDDQEVWKSNSDIAAAQVITEDVLGPGKSWKMSSRIPLIVEDQPLAVGVYTVQAFLNADKSVSATSTFEVIPAPGLNNGIKGLVVKEVLAGSVETGAIVPTPIPGARVTITEILNGTEGRSPFIWSGNANSEGRFTVQTPPGRFRVTAYEPFVITIKKGVIGIKDDIAIINENSDQLPGPIIIPPITTIPRSVSTEVTVQDGTYSDVTLTFTLNTITQGIRGHVRMGGSFQPVLVPMSVSPTIPDVGLSITVLNLFQYKVRITQIEQPVGSAAFEWSGVADAYGNFQVATPPGKFVVSGQRVLAPGVFSFVAIPSATDTETVTVAPNAVSTVNLVLQIQDFVTF